MSEPTKRRQIVLEIVDKLESDLMSREGLEEQWRQIKPAVREEIRQSWVKMVAEILDRRLP